MKIAVTSQDRKTITEHAGRCRKFWIFEIEDQQIVKHTLLELPKEQSFHDCSRQDAHPLDSVDVLISGGMGQGLIARLAGRGIKGIITEERDPEQAVSCYLGGSLKALESDACKHDGCTCSH